MRGTIPAWLQPVTLKTAMTLPYTLYRIDYSAPGGKKVAQQR
jgi:aromatic ring-opening dioxygenase catalytic subunit (LigB family)